MGISINTNLTATGASQFLTPNHQNLQKSLNRLSSGKRITQPSNDSGGLALEHTEKALRGLNNNISNAISLLQVQDGALSSIGEIVGRIGELKSIYDDVTKNTFYDGVEQITAALEYVATQRATNGGEVNRLRFGQPNMDSQITNLTAAKGRIMDVDIASESSDLAKNQILVQASAAMTAQANMSNDMALLLLQ